MVISAFALGLADCGCDDDFATETEGVDYSSVSVPDLPEDEELESDSDDEAEEISLAEAEPTPEKVKGEELSIYENHHLWCEWPKPPKCGKEKVQVRGSWRKKWVDHGKCGTDHRGEKLRCVRPWRPGNTKDTHKVCIPKFPKRSEQDWRRKRLRHVIGRGFDLTGEWWVNAVKSHQASRAMRVYRYFKAVVVRETSMRPFKIHRLPPDVEAAYESYRRHKKKGTYEGNPNFDGYRVLAGPGEREGLFTFEEIVNAETYDDAETIKAQIESEHPDWIVIRQSNPARWLSYGYTGQQSAGWVFEVDKMAPPEVLCLETFAVETYLRRMRRVAGKLDRKYDCKDADGKPYKRDLLRSKEQKRDHVRETFRPATWHTIHRATSGGRMCPRNADTWTQTKRGFERRADMHGLNAHQHVSRRMLGRNLTPEEMMEIEKELDEIYCPTYESWLVKEETGVCG